MPRPMIKVKRVYDAPTETDGTRVLVDRLWPRGVSKGKAAIKSWEKEVAPSNALREWFNHDPDKWAEFRERYWRWLSSREDEINRLLSMARTGDLTLVYSAKDERYNNAVALKEYLDEMMRPKRNVT